MNVRAALPCVLVLVCGCNGPSQSGTAAVDGSIGGTPFLPRDAIATTLGDGYGDSEAVIVLSDVPDLCGRAARGEGLRNAHVLMLTLGTSGAASGIVAPDRPALFTRKPPGVFSLWAFATDAACGLVDGSESVPGPLNSTNGYVDLTSVEDGAYAGSFEIPLFDMDLAPQGVIRGRFHAGVCADAPEIVALPPARTISRCE